jgi:hypothetical protein
MAIIFPENRLINLLLHALFWILFLLAGSFLVSYEQDFPYLFYFFSVLVNIPVYMAFTYVVVYLLVPKLLLHRRIVLFVVLLALTSFLFSMLKILVSKHVFFAYFIPKVLHPEEWFTREAVFTNMLWVLMPAVIFAMIKFFTDWVSSVQKADEAERKRLVSELQLLKAQLNPHFLFNTFNNLYVLALQKSDKTPEVISKMSDLFHYILYECNAMEVPVEKEITLIENYIELEQLRYADRLNVRFEKEIGTPFFPIAPMLLFTFVENCFKHGSSKDPGSPWIFIRIKTTEDWMYFQARNSLPESKPTPRNTTGLGLANIQKRLGLIYPGQHVLRIEMKEDCFEVNLDIKRRTVK